MPASIRRRAGLPIMRDHVLLYVNGRRTEVRGAHVLSPLSSFLRDILNQTGTKIVCAEGSFINDDNECDGHHDLPGFPSNGAGGNGFDDNCNGLVDEGACPTDVGWQERTDVVGNDWVTASNFGRGRVWIAGKNHVVRKHDFIFLPPGVEHAISNSGLVDLVFLVITSPVTDDEKPA